MMMRKNTRATATTGFPPHMNGGGAHTNGGGVGGADEGEWEMRPGGMLVQRRNPDLDRNIIPPPTIRVRVKYGSVYHQVNISSQSSFGELKKMLTEPTGLHHEDQKLMYKDRVRDSKAYLDIAGVKDRSKMVLVEDPISQEKRFLEMRKNAKMEKASKLISDISLEVDRLAGQVSAFETIISKGAKVEEKSLTNLIELLMNQLIKLDGIIADGDAKLQRKMQVKRVQKYVETLDVLKVKNSKASPGSNGNHQAQAQAQDQQKYSNGQTQHHHTQFQNQSKFANGKKSATIQYEQRQSLPPIPETANSTEWETFELELATTTTTTAAANTNTTPPILNPSHQKFNWEFFE